MNKSLISNIPARGGCGVYALVDTKGKHYIGSSVNVGRRVYGHLLNFNDTINKGHSAFVNPEMETALLSGETFTCKVLCSFSCKMSQKELMEVERIFVDKFGGYENTYNMKHIKHRV